MQIQLNGAPADIFGDIADKHFVCGVLGISANTLKRWVSEGRIPHFRLGDRKLVRFRKSEIAAWVAGKH